MIFQGMSMRSYECCHQGDEHQPRFPGSAQSETNSLWLGREAPPVGSIEEGQSARFEISY